MELLVNRERMTNISKAINRNKEKGIEDSVMYNYRRYSASIDWRIYM
jgi:hypothetical protein